ncbi:MAG: ATP-binding protein [Pirellulaceae bacterium]|nr:ATP-binding protein [Pirellulaceae bacterium]
MIQDFEKLGVFYLGKPYDPQQNRPLDGWMLYDSKDLTTHAVCVGMTGSGKTGLCLSLLEEAAIDGIPAIAIDPKGDLGNLLLAFPELKSEDFRPWVDEAEAARQDKSVDEFAVQEAEKWRLGLAEWGQDAARIARYRDAVEIAVYTPGSNAGLPLTILRSFDAPAAALVEDGEAFRERVSAAASGLLALLGIDADPVQSREHILLANLFDRSWRDGRNLPIADLIRAIQSPPFDKVGFLDLETFFPAEDRFRLATRVNNLFASPGFAGWLEGEPLNVGRLLYTEQGKPRLSIVSIAHLSDAERMFFVTILLNEVVSWMRTQPGTSSLRAILYMDEVFGYFPPTANPPSKLPMLTLLKQARAFGLGVVLATQNPVDLDYKGLSNAGTWFLGRLQTERDKARVLDGLEGASAAAGRGFDRRAMEATLAGLGRRVFVMNNVHENEPVLFQTRWTLSYLRGPLTRQQISQLTASRKNAERDAQQAGEAAASASASVAASGPSAASPTAAAAAMPADVGHDSSNRPVLPPGISERFLAAEPPPAGKRLMYRPGLLGTARLHYVHAKSKTDAWQSLALWTTSCGGDPGDAWTSAERIGDGESEFQAEPAADAGFASLPTELVQAKAYAAWTKALKEHLYRECPLVLKFCPQLSLFAREDESESDFRIRLQTASREQRDVELEKLKKRYEPKLATLMDQKRRAEERVGREKSQYRQQQLSAAVSVGASILGALFGRKLTSTTNVTRAASAMKGIGKSVEQRDDIGRATETVEQIEEKIAKLESEFQEEIGRIEEQVAADRLALEEVVVRPRKTDIAVGSVVLLWTPWYVDADGIAERGF